MKREKIIESFKTVVCEKVSKIINTSDDGYQFRVRISEKDFSRLLKNKELQKPLDEWEKENVTWGFQSCSYIGNYKIGSSYWLWCNLSKFLPRRPF